MPPTKPSCRVVIECAPTRKPARTVSAIIRAVVADFIRAAGITIAIQPAIGGIKTQKVVI